MQLDTSVWQHHGLCSAMDTHRQQILYYIKQHMKTFIQSAFLFRAHVFTIGLFNKYRHFCLLSLY